MTLLITFSSIQLKYYCHVFGSVCFCFVNRSSVIWNECNRVPNLDGRFVSSWNFRFDSVACFIEVRWLWLKTDFIVFERNRLFVRFVCMRHPLGPISSANFDARNVSRWISSIARLKRIGKSIYYEKFNEKFTNFFLLTSLNLLHLLYSNNYLYHLMVEIVLNCRSFCLILTILLISSYFLRFATIFGQAIAFSFDPMTFQVNPKRRLIYRNIFFEFYKMKTNSKRCQFLS